MKKFIKKLISILVDNINKLKKGKKELEDDLKTFKNQENPQSFYSNHEEKRKLLGCNPTLNEEYEEIELSFIDKCFSLLDISFEDLLYIFLTILFFSWFFVKIHIPIKIVELLIGLFTVMYFHIEINKMPKHIIYSSTWIQYILAFLIPSIIVTIGFLIITFNPKVLQHLLFYKFYIEKLNYIGLTTVFDIAVFVKIIVYTFKKITYKNNLNILNKNRNNN